MLRFASLVVPAVLAVAAGPLFAQRPNTTSWTMALSGQPAAGAGGQAFSGFGPPLMGNNGRLVPGTLAGSPGGSVDGLWLTNSGFGSPSDLLLAAKGGAAPGVAGANFSSFDAWTPNGFARLGGPTASFAATTSNGLSGLWRGAPGQVGLLAVQGAAAPGMESGSTFASFTGLRGSHYHSAFRALAGTPSGTQSGIWWGDPGALRLFARTGQVAPGTGGARFTDLGDPGLNTSEVGQVAFRATLDTPSPTPDSGIWWGAPGSDLLFLLHRSGDAVSGLPLFFDTFDDPKWGSGGPLSFRATFRGPGVGPANNVGILAGQWDAPFLVARTGDVAPGTGGATFARLGQPTQSDFGGGRAVAFLATVAGASVNASNDDSVWAADPRLGGSTQTLTLLAREGAPAPGASGATFASFETPVADFAFVGKLAGAGVDSSNDRGIWVEDPYAPGGLGLAVREGDTLAVAPGDIRTIRNLLVAPTGSDTNGEPSWNVSGRYFVFAAEFADGTSGAFQMIYTPVPEPAAGTVLLAGLPLLAQRRRRP